MLLSYPVYRAVRRFALPAAIAVCCSWTTAAQSDAVKKDSAVGQLLRWSAAVDAHIPGERDDAIVEMASLTPLGRSRLLGVAVPFAIYLRRLPDLAVPPGVRLSPQELDAVAALAKRLSTERTFARWLHRAVMFETDVAVLAPDLTAAAMAGARGTGLPEGIRADDGELGSRNLLNWHWRFARDLVDVRDPATSDAFAASWYHTVALHQLSVLSLAEMDAHVGKALQLFPSDPRMLFDSACWSDAMGSARVQAVLIGELPRDFRPRVPRGDDAETRAMGQFDGVLRMDPTFVEARVRLARLKEKHGNAAEALALLDQAFRQRMPKELEYMAHLVAGRASAAVGRRDAAVEHLNAALRLFPTAQAPVVSLSLIALQNDDIDRAVGLAASLRSHGARGDRNDPWWWYFESPWFNSWALLDQLYDEVRK